MTNQEYRKALATLGLSIIGAGTVLGVTPRHSQRIAAGHVPVPEPIAKLLRVMVRHGLAPEDLD